MRMFIGLLTGAFLLTLVSFNFDTDSSITTSTAYANPSPNQAATFGANTPDPWELEKQKFVKITRIGSDYWK